MQSHLEQEQRKHCDIVQFNFIDSFFNVSIKTANHFHYIYLTKWDDISGPPEFYFFTQSDLYINIPRVAELQSQFAKDIKWKTESILAQHECDPNPPAVHGRYWPKRPPSRHIMGNGMDKYLDPPYIIDEDIPNEISGTVGFYPRGTIPCLVTTSWYFPMLPIEDHWTPLLFRQCGIEVKEIKECFYNFGEKFNSLTVAVNLGHWNGNFDLGLKRQEVHSQFLKHHEKMQK